jgi:hypothetical protein
MTSPSSPASPSFVGWQIGLFAVLLIGSFLAETPARLLMGLGFDSGSGFWSTGMVVTRIAEAVLRTLIVALLIALACRPKLAPGRPLITNWFSAFMLSWIALEVLSTALRLGLAFVQHQMFTACQAAGGADCYGGMSAVNIAYGVVTIGVIAVFFGLLTQLARPADGFAYSGNGWAGNGWILGAIAGGIMAIIGLGISLATTSLYAGSSGFNVSMWLYPVLFTLLDAIILSVTLGFWRRGYSQSGAGGMALRFD